MIKEEQSSALASGKPGGEVMIAESVKVDESMNKSILQTDQNVSSFLKVGVD
jgi:hypothetical protein